MALVLGIAGIVVCFVGSILALVFGYKGRREIDASEGTQTGRGMATAGIVLGWVWVGVLGLTIVVIIIAALASSGSS